MAYDSAQSLLMSSGGYPSLDFGKIPPCTKGGRVVNGPIEYNVREYDARNPGKGPLRTDEAGQPIKAVYIDLQTTERDPQNPRDTGIRRVYAEKWRMRDAIRDAILAVGARGLEHGADLWITFTGHEAGEGAQPAQTWSAVYVPPASAALMSSQPAAPAPAPAYVPPAAPAYAPAPATVPPVAYTPPAPAYAPPAAPPAPPVAPAYAAAVATPPEAMPLQAVPRGVYEAMRNSGMDVSRFTPDPAS